MKKYAARPHLAAGQGEAMIADQPLARVDTFKLGREIRRRGWHVPVNCDRRIVGGWQFEDLRMKQG